MIRTATKKDLNAVIELNNKLLLNEFNNFDPYIYRNWTKFPQGIKHFKKAIKNKLVMVAVEDEKIVGFLLCAITKIEYYNFKIGELVMMYVEEAYRRRGIATALMNSSIENFKSIGIEKFMLTASTKNEKAHLLYKKLGFENLNSIFVKF